MGYFDFPDKEKQKEPTVIEYETRRPTVTRTAGMTVLFGPIGGLIGLAWRKKKKNRIVIN